MESIVPKVRYIDCPYCLHPISSSKAICPKCGLEVSAKGVEELAQIEEQISDAVNDAGNLKLIASFPFGYSFVNLIYFFAIDPQAIWLNIPLWGGYVYFAISFVKWQRKYSRLIFNPDDLEKIRRDKRGALTLIVCSMIVGFGLAVLFR